ncbi:MAG: hypothetical protein AAFV29_27770 [Myxococcota bacterium]
MPALSRAVTVLSNVGAAGLSAMAATSFSIKSAPCLNAGMNSFVSTLSHGGTPPFGPDHSLSSTSYGLGAEVMDAALEAGALAGALAGGAFDPAQPAKAKQVRAHVAPR